MTKDEYLAELKNNIQALTLDEQQEALQYYSDYFDEAGDDQKVISELGTPENLAQTIVQKFANAVAKNASTQGSDAESETDSGAQTASDALYYSFDKALVHSLQLKFGAADVMVIPGDMFSVETRGISGESLVCSLNADGLLTVGNTFRRLNFGFAPRIGRKHPVPRILITVPNGAHVQKLRVELGAGNFRTKDIQLYCEEGRLEAGAGNLVAKGIFGGRMDFRCGMGNLELEGTLSGESRIDCGMGAVKLALRGNVADYSYDAKIGLGDFRLNDEKKSGVCQITSDERRQNHFFVSCGMGAVTIKIQ